MARYNISLYTVICFVAVGLLNIRSVKQGPDDVRVKELSFISENIAKALSQARQDAHKVEVYLRTDTLTFSTLQDKMHFPGFVYRGDELIYWSSHTIFPEPDNSPIQDSIKLLENKFGKYLLFRKAFRHNYQVQVYIPLETNFPIQNYFLESGLNKEIFGHQQLLISVFPGAGQRKFPVYAPGGKFLFSVEHANPAISRASGKATLALVVLGLVFFVTSLVLMSRRLIRQGSYIGGVMLLVLPLLQVRYAMLYFNFPFSIVDLTAFDPKLYAASFWSPSIGDLLLNVMLLAVIAWNLLYLFRKLQAPAKVRKLPPAVKTGLAIGLGALHFLVLSGLFYFYYNLFTNSLLVLDITQSVQFTVYKLMLYLAIAIHTSVFFIFSFMVMQLFSALHIPKKQLLLVLVAVLLILFLINTLPFFTIEYILFGFSLVFCAVAYIWGRRTRLRAIPYQMYLFVFLILGISAVVGSLAVYEHYLNQLQVHKQKFASGLLMNNDIQGEFLLEQVASDIQQDPIIQSKLKGAYVDESFIKRKISKYYLGGYFDKYETNIRIFDSNGKSSNPTDSITHLPQYHVLLNRFMPTEHKGLYLYNDRDQRNRKYVKLVPVAVNPEQTAIILLELTLKKLTPYSVVPELLVDQRFSQPLLTNKVSYGVFANNRLQYSEGDFDYVNYFPPERLELANLYKNGIMGQKNHHLGVISNDKIVIITTPKYTYTNIFSNFSFLFLVHALALADS